jgi:hypothetical protein
MNRKEFTDKYSTKENITEMNEDLDKLIIEPEKKHYYEWGIDGCICVDCDKQIDHT